MLIRELDQFEQPPIQLLLLADPSESMVQGYLEKGRCYVAEESGEVVGVYIIWPKNKRVIELVNISVAISEQKKGVGKSLVKHAINEAKKSHYKWIEVGTGNSSIDQLAFYQKCGFRMDRIEKNFFLTHYQESIIENDIVCRDKVMLSKSLDQHCS
ncbi:GNAT family N-acetyltransferase [Bacillus sp. FJAT-45037]|uniref:GNAT family N-acetyltransferase n=1 Tax=Bacillus sp. FJAT-45037 TaxID=2011007 RepID=UPI000C23587C|nr:GNAT family N-acetyltransferase [Bacillus sp. FJAT-45037]